MLGPLECRYLQVRPSATTGRDVGRWFGSDPNRWFTHAEIKMINGFSDRIIREQLPEAVSDDDLVCIEIDKLGQA